MEFLFRNVRILNGANEASYIGCVGVEKGKIVLNDLPDTADRVIDGNGRYLAPGFIDAHSHGDMVLGKDFGCLCKINQGVTTQIAGQCGSSMGPVSKAHMAEHLGTILGLSEDVPDELESFDTWSKYLQYAEAQPKITNFGLFVGYNFIRTSVMGYTDRVPTSEEMEKMKSLIRDAMEHGALGMSSGLAYVPGTFSTLEEMVELASVLAPYGGIYTTHIRNEAQDLVPSVREVLEIGRRAGVAVNISHFKACGRDNWGSHKEAIALIEQARAEGIRVTLDQYPYNQTMTHLYPSMPPWYFTEGLESMLSLITDPATRAKIRKEMEDPASSYDNLYRNAGGWTGVTICLAEKNPEAQGKTLAEYAESIGKDGFDVFFDLLIENAGVVMATYHSIGDADIQDIIRLPYTMVGSDGIVRSRYGKCHPRGWATMVHALDVFRDVLPLHTLVHKMTGLTADIYGLRAKGYIREGYDADLVLMDYENLQDNATYADPCALAGGIDLVIIGGKAVYENGQLTGEHPGMILKR